MPRPTPPRTTLLAAAVLLAATLAPAAVADLETHSCADDEDAPEETVEDARLCACEEVAGAFSNNTSYEIRCVDEPESATVDLAPPEAD